MKRAKGASVELRAQPGYFRAFATIMSRIQNAVAGADRGRPVLVCVAGGAALHLYTGRPVSKDIDAKVMARFLPPENLEVAYKGDDGHARVLYFDTQYNDSYALLHRDAYRDAIPIEVPGIDRKRLEVRLLAPVDLAVSKLSRYEGHDQGDIAALARAGLIDAKSLRMRAEEALPDYVGNVEHVRNSIALAERLVKREAVSLQRK
jgi:hypothetical protein